MYVEWGHTKISVDIEARYGDRNQTWVDHKQSKYINLFIISLDWITFYHGWEKAIIVIDGWMPGVILKTIMHETACSSSSNNEL